MSHIKFMVMKIKNLLYLALIIAVPMLLFPGCSSSDDESEEQSTGQGGGTGSGTDGSGSGTDGSGTDGSGEGTDGSGTDGDDGGDTDGSGEGTDGDDGGDDGGTVKDDEYALIPASKTVNCKAQEVTFTVQTDVDYELTLAADCADWLSIVDEGSRADDDAVFERYVVTLSVEANSNDYVREGTIDVLFHASPEVTLTFTLTQNEYKDYVDYGDPSMSIIGDMERYGDVELAEPTIEVLGTLTYELSMSKTGYGQGTVSVAAADVAEVLGLTTAEVRTRANSGQLDCVPMNADWSVGENTAGSTYGAWFGSTGTVDWGSDAICYLEGSTMWRFDYGAYESNTATSCTMRLQYRDLDEWIGCNAVFSVTLK